MKSVSAVEGGGIRRSRPGDERPSRAKRETYAFIQLKDKPIYLVSPGSKLLTLLGLFGVRWDVRMLERAGHL